MKKMKFTLGREKKNVNTDNRNEKVELSVFISNVIIFSPESPQITHTAPYQLPSKGEKITV